MWTLYTTDYLEYYLTLIGWVISNGIWDTLADTGLFAVPFFVMILQEWLRARAEGADERNKGALSMLRVENRVWVAVTVILFAVMPLISIDVSTIDYDTSRSIQCQAYVPAVVKPEETGWGLSFTEINGQSAKVPVWWFLLHSLAKAVTSSAIAAIPCGTDLRQMRMEVDSTRINDPLLAQEVADFTRDCYGPSRAKMFQSRPSLSPEEQNDVTWIGSARFLADSDFYASFHSSKPRVDWPYDEARDSGYAQVASGGGYPSCFDWWVAPEIGLRARLLATVDPTLLQRFGQWANFLSQDQVNDSVIREVVAPRHQAMTKGVVYADYGGQLDHTWSNATTRAASDVGLGLSSLSHFPSMDKVRQALPMILSFLKMAVVISLPLVLVMGTYNLKTLVTASIIQFAIFFVEFWFQLARWIDSTIINALYGWNAPHSTFNPIMGLNNATGDMVLNWVMAAMFIVLPMFWMTALSWAGFNAGSALDGLTKGSQDAKAGASKGVDMVINKVT
ncbi:conjugal transfer protein TraG N-terminal domain-containing protein [Azomonas macrocytogenes]|uniref:TraG N-terminal Proteobacteria domain-containing protein n=1 Tax=Azomonas macrocytogenes TaxID=69962 RepID=A0A839T8C7_AZOMA|nr:conjugal transfer protein TraG N-terminal domain-containing protein [Azomonas macrocytogenes]MBB3105348.1 hypothetical protein [Azomonas macrocytogenes]